MRITILLLLLTFTVNIANSQKFTVQNFTDENGLPQNSVKSIATDNSGFIWLATENGLVRYDGQKFLLFDKNKTKANTNRIISIQKQFKTEKLYGITEYWDLIEIKDGKVSSNPISYESVFNFKNSTHNTHFFTWGAPNGIEFYNSKLPYLIQNKNGYTYKIFNQTISIYKQKKLLNVIKFKYNSQYRFFLLANELYYLNEDLSLFKLENNKIIPIKLENEIIKKIGLHSIRLFWNINTGNVFIGFEDSLYELSKEKNNQNVKTKKIIYNLNFDALGIKSIYSKNNEIYIGTLTKGLFIYKTKQFNTLVPENNYENNVFYAQVPLANNEVLFANGYLFDKSKSNKRFNFFDKLSNRYTIAIDKDQNIWTAKTSTLYMLRPDLKKVVNSYIFPTAVNMISIADDQTIYVGNKTGVYFLRKNDNKFKSIKKLSKIDDVSVIQKAGQFLWIGTHKGLMYYDFEKDAISHIKTLKNKDIRSIHIRDQQVWVTTYGDGFYLINNNKIIRLPNDKSDYLNAAHCILEDKNGFFWISTNKGLFKVAITDLLAYASKKTNSVYYIYYDKSAGFNTNEFNGGCQPCGSILSDGDFVFPSMNGITLFNPTTLISSIPDKPIYIDNITLDNKVIPGKQEEIYIPNNFNRLTFNLSTPYFGNKENLNFEYKLANQKIWTQSTDQLISFSYLPTGKNTLNIRKVNGFGVDNYSYKNIVLIVEPHFYQTWWFILAALISISLLIYYYIKLRTKIVSERNLQLEKSIDESTLELQTTIKAYEFSKNRLDHQTYFQSRLISAITHDIKSPLKYLMMTGESLYKSRSNEVDKDGLKAIFTSSSQIYHFTDNLVQYAKGFTTKDLETKQKFNLCELMEEKIAIFKSIAKSHNTLILNEVNSEIIITNNKHLLSVIIHNLLDNAVKFTSNGKITIAFNKIELEYKITINDTGHGMNSYQLEWCNSNEDSLDQTISIEKNPSPAGLGLIMVKEIIKIIKGKLFASAIEGKGTTFEITFTD